MFNRVQPRSSGTEADSMSTVRQEKNKMDKSDGAGGQMQNQNGYPLI